jgi:3-oxoacyl-[acyl-carrier protein] reductase
MKRLVIVTGASQGIGREAALLLSENNCDLVLAARSESALQKVARECDTAGANVTVVKGDLTEDCACATLIERAKRVGEDHYPVLINNAGMGEFGSFDQQSFEVFERHAQVNYLVGARLCHAAIPWMLGVGGGQIINVLSIASTHAFSGAAAYCSSKAAIRMLTQVLAQEYRARGIRMTSLIPGSTDTPFWDKIPMKPETRDMMPTTAVAEAIRDLVLMPKDRNVDELVLMPPNGIL